MGIRSKFLAVLTVGFLLTASAQAGIVATYTDRTTWEAALGSFLTEDFESFTETSAPAGGTTFDLTLFDLLIDENHGDIGIGTTTVSDGYPVIAGRHSFFGDVHDPDPQGVDTPQFNNVLFGVPMVAFGAEFADGDAGGITFHVDGDTWAVNLGTASFFGIIADPFTTVEIRGGTTGSGYFVMDDVSFSAVPEPASLALLGLGLAGLGLYIRRR